MPATFTPKPPLGIETKRLWKMRRVIALIETLHRYSQVDDEWNTTFMAEHATELQDLILQLKNDK